jgi:hypothetical protein
MQTDTLKKQIQLFVYAHAATVCYCSALTHLPLRKF